MKKRKLPLMIILWEDHVSYASDHDWLTPDEVEPTNKPAVIHSVGWLCRETKKNYILAATLDEEDGMVGQTMSILKSAVVRKCTLKQPE